MDFKVGVFDSGIGGLSILSELEKVLEIKISKEIYEKLRGVILD